MQILALFVFIDIDKRMNKITFKWLCLKCYCQRLTPDQRFAIKMSCARGIDKCSCCRKRKAVHEVFPLTEDEINEKQLMVTSRQILQISDET